MRGPRDALVRWLRNETFWPYVAPVLRPLAVPFKRAWLLAPAFVLFTAMNLLHATFRSSADDVAPFAPVNAAQFDIAVFGTAPSVALQDWLGASGFWASFAFLYWTTLFWVPVLLVGVVVLSRGKGYFLRLLLLHMALVLSADIIYAAVPSRPPWMDLELVRIIAIESGEGVRFDSNPMAALPSLHVAVPLLYALWFRGFEPSSKLRRLWPWLMAWAVVMSWCVVYTGEHYVIDVVTGFAWAGIVYVVMDRTGLLHPRTSTAQPPSRQNLEGMPAPAERAA